MMNFQDETQVDQIVMIVTKHSVSCFKVVLVLFKIDEVEI